jgi:MFS family permease
MEGVVVPAQPLRNILGLPSVAGRRSVLIAAGIDSIGSGLFLPFAVLYFLRTTPLSLTAVGAGLSAAAALVIAVVPITGMAVDRFGATGCVVVANMLQAAGFAGYLAVHALWQLVLFTLLVATGSRLFWTANGAFVALVADPGERIRWFGLLRGLRNGGFALGGALAAIAATAGSRSAYHLVVMVNATSFLLAGLLVAGQRRLPSNAAHRATAPPHSWFGYRAALTDRAFLLLLAANFCFVLCMLVLDVLLTIEVTGPLHRPAWLASLLFTLSGAFVLAGQTPLTRRIERHRRTRVLELAAALWAACFLVMATLPAVPASAIVAGLIVAVLVFTAAEMLALPVLNELVLILAPAQQQGRYFAVQGLTWIAPQAIAPAAFTWLFAHGSQWPWLTLIGICGVSLATLGRLRTRLPASADHPRPATDLTA